jgi:hypothetical protein
MKGTLPLIVVSVLLTGVSGVQAVEPVPAYVTVAPHPSGTELGLAYVQVRGERLVEPPMVEVAPDPFSYDYRHGDRVYKEMAEHSFDSEPMQVVFPETDPALAPPPVVVVPASVDQPWVHIVAAQQVVDPIARGEDKIFLELSEPPAPINAVEPPGQLQKSKERRFFSTPLPE